MWICRLNILRLVSGVCYSRSLRRRLLNSFQTSGNSPGSLPCRADLHGVSTVGSALARLTGPDSISLLELTQIVEPIAPGRGRAAVVPAPVLAEPQTLFHRLPDQRAEAV